jgi:hypothetical protein
MYPSVSSCLLKSNNFKTAEWIVIKCTFSPFQFCLKLDNNWHLTLTPTHVSLSICRVTEERSQEWNIILRKFVQKEKTQFMSTPNLGRGLSVSQTNQLGMQTPFYAPNDHIYRTWQTLALGKKMKLGLCGCVSMFQAITQQTAFLLKNT